MFFVLFLISYTALYNLPGCPDLGKLHKKNSPLVEAWEAKEAATCQGSYKEISTNTHLSYFAAKLTSRILYNIHKILIIIIHSNLINLLSQE